MLYDYLYAHMQGGFLYMGKFIRFVNIGVARGA